MLNLILGSRSSAKKNVQFLNRTNKVVLWYRCLFFEIEPLVSEMIDYNHLWTY